MAPTPREYQLDGATFLASHRRALLADEPGVGKTMQALLGVMATNPESVLVICPSIARFHWERQCALWELPYEVSVMLTSTDRPSTPVVICSYDLAIREAVADWLCEQQWGVLILDESQYLKSPSTKRSRLIWRRLIHRADYCWCLSGTPARNHAGDLWPMLSAFGAYRQSYWEFVDDFLIADTGLYGTTIRGTQPHKRAALRALLAPVMLRRTKEDVLAQLPSLTYDECPVEPTPVDLTRWMTETKLSGAAMRGAVGKQALQIHTALNQADSPEEEYDALMQVQKEVAVSRRYFGLQKAPTVAATVAEELAEGQYEKIVLFAWHRDVLQLLLELLYPYDPLILVGGMDARAKDDALEAFHNDPRHKVMLAQILAAGVAVDMTAAAEVGFVELSYVPSDNAQAVMRVHRYPQTKPVRCRLFTLRQSIDERITRILQRKINDLTQLFPTSTEGEMTT